MQGVEYDKSGKRVAYWLYDSHPGEYGFRESRRVDALNVIHLYEVLRPGQVRGIPFGVSAMMRLKDFDDYEDAELVRQKIAACFAAFVVDADPSSSVGSGDNDMIERLEPGIIEHLPPGKQIEFASPPTTGNYDNYSRKILQAIASGYGITYESLTGDLSNVNFSSGRMGWLEMQRQIESWQWDMMVPMMCQPVWSWFTDAAAIMGLSTGDLSVEWTAPRREMIDPVKETNAIVTQIRAGIRSWPEAIREQGYEPDQVLTEIAEFNTKVDSKGIILDTDPRKTKAEQLKAEPEAPQNQNQQ
jgi:lambda family phage portal protein